MKIASGNVKDDGEPNTELEGDEIFPKVFCEGSNSTSLSAPGLAPAISAGNRSLLRHSYLIYFPLSFFSSSLQFNPHFLTFPDSLLSLSFSLKSSYPPCLSPPDPSAPSLLASCRRSSPSLPSAGPHPPVSRGEVSGASPRAHFVSNPLDLSRMRAFRPPIFNAKLMVDPRQLN